MAKDIRRVLVIKLGALGDVMQALGPMKAIRTHHPDAHIAVLTGKPFAGLLEKTALFNEVLIDQKPKWFDLKGWLALRSRLNAGRYDRVYDLQNNDRTCTYFKLFAPQPEWVGIAKGASHRNESPIRSAGHAFYGHVQTLALAGIENVQPDDLSWLDADLSPLNLPERYAVIVPGSAPQHLGKRWPHFAALCTRLLKEGIQPILIGTEAEREDIDVILSHEPNARSLVGLTKLWDLPALARGAVGVIGNDTGPMHLMGPTGARTVVLMGPLSNPKRHYPLGENVRILHNEALGDITPDQALAALQSAM